MSRMRTGATDTDVASLPVESSATPGFVPYPGLHRLLSYLLRVQNRIVAVMVGWFFYKEWTDRPQGRFFPSNEIRLS